MRILYVSGERLDKAGGTPLRIREIVLRWLTLGHSVVVLAPSYGRSPRPKWPSALSLVHLPPRSVASYALFEALAPIAVPLRALRQRSDIVISTGGVLSWWVHKALRLVGIKYVVEVNGVADLEAARMKLPPMVGRIYASAIRALGLYRGADHFICVAQGIKEELSLRWPPFATQSTVIENGVDPERFAAVTRDEARNRIGVDPDIFVFGFVGLLCPWHGTEDLIQASRVLATRGYRNFRTLIVGGGERYDDLRRQAMGLEGIVQFTGRVPAEDVPMYTNAFDVACQVHNDPEIGRLGNSMKFWEYLASGVPVIVSTCSEASRHVRSGLVGWRFSGGDPRDLADKMEAAMNAPEECRRIGEANRRYVAEQHRWEDVAREMAELLSRVARQ